MSNAAQFVGDIPKHYDEHLGPIIFADYAADLARRAAALGPGGVLELAAGTGISTRALRAALPASTPLVATDLNPPMLEIAKRKFELGANVTFTPADAMALPFPDAAFDLVACQFGVMFFPDKVAAFRETRRVLKRGGAFLFNVWGAMAANPFSQIAVAVGARFFPDNPPKFYNTPFGYFDPAIVRADLAEAGFADVSHEVVRIDKEVRDWRHFAIGTIYGNPIIAEIEAHPTVKAEDMLAATIAALRERFGPEPTRMPLEALVFSARNT